MNDSVASTKRGNPTRYYVDGESLIGRKTGSPDVVMDLSALMPANQGALIAEGVVALLNKGASFADICAGKIPDRALPTPKPKGVAAPLLAAVTKVYTDAKIAGEKAARTLPTVPQHRKTAIENITTGAAAFVCAEAAANSAWWQKAKDHADVKAELARAKGTGGSILDMPEPTPAAPAIDLPEAAD